MPWQFFLYYVYVYVVDVLINKMKLIYKVRRFIFTFVLTHDNLLWGPPSIQWDHQLSTMVGNAWFANAAMEDNINIVAFFVGMNSGLL